MAAAFACHENRDILYHQCPANKRVTQYRGGDYAASCPGPTEVVLAKDRC